MGVTNQMDKYKFKRIICLTPTTNAKKHTYPIPIISGSQPCTLYEASLANGFKSCSLTASSDAKIIDPAPSQIPEALAAVTTPSFLKTGRRADIFSRELSGRGCSSVSMIF